MLLSEVIREISVDLNDQEPGYEYTRWTIDQLQTYVREGLITIGRPLKDLFTKSIVVKVQPGAGWQQACDCTVLRRIVGETDSYGNILRYLSRSLDKEENTWAGSVQRCSVDPKKYSMSGYSISASQPNEFKVTPPVPPGITRYVMVECYTYNTAYDLNSDIPDEVVPMIKQWAIYRALSVDSENNQTIVSLAQQHYKVFNDMLSAAVAIRELEKKDGSDLRTVQKPPAS